MTLRIPMQAIAVLLFFLASWGGALGIAVGVTEWRDDSDDDLPTAEAFDADRCLAAVAFFQVIDSFATPERLTIVSTLLKDSTVESAWNEAFGSMVDGCRHVR